MPSLVGIPKDDSDLAGKHHWHTTLRIPKSLAKQIRAAMREEGSTVFSQWAFRAFSLAIRMSKQPKDGEDKPRPKEG